MTNMNKKEFEFFIEYFMGIYPLNYIPSIDTYLSDYEKGKVAGANWSRSQFIRNLELQRKAYIEYEKWNK